MLQVIADAKKYQLSNGQIVIVKRITLRDYYLLVSSLYIYQKSTMIITKINKNKLLKEIQENALDIAKVQIEFDNIKNIVQKYVNIKIENLDKILIIEMLNCIIDFNTIKIGIGSEFKSIDEINESLEIIIGIVSNILHIQPNEVLEMDNYYINLLIKEHNRQRINIINDIRLAYHADKDSYTKYTRGLLGEKVYSAQEIMDNPSILKGVH